VSFHKLGYNSSLYPLDIWIDNDEEEQRDPLNIIINYFTSMNGLVKWKITFLLKIFNKINTLLSESSLTNTHQLYRFESGASSTEELLETTRYTDMLNFLSPISMQGEQYYVRPLKVSQCVITHQLPVESHPLIVKVLHHIVGLMYAIKTKRSQVWNHCTTIRIAANDLRIILGQQEIKGGQQDNPQLISKRDKTMTVAINNYEAISSSLSSNMDKLVLESVTHLSHIALF